MVVVDLLLGWRTDPLGVVVVGRLPTTHSMRQLVMYVQGVTAMITKALYPDDLRPALACLNNRPERTTRSPERWMIHRPDGSFAIYLVTGEGASVAHSQPSLTGIPELALPDVATALSLPQPANTASRFLGGCSDELYPPSFGGEEVTDEMF